VKNYYNIEILKSKSVKIKLIQEKVYASDIQVVV